MNNKHLPIYLLFSVLLSCSKPAPIQEFWLTDPKGGVLFELIKEEQFSKDSLLTLVVDSETTYQSMDGFGFTLSQGSAKHLLAMSDSARYALLKELFGNGEKDIRISYLRLSVAASDLNEFPFSYNDLEDSLATDPELAQFSFSYDTLDILPILKQITAINPEIKLMASPWSPPKWMKDNKDSRGGSLLEEFEPVYAQYLVRYIQEMDKLGFSIEALTIQNEPLHPGNNPSLLMLPEQQARFIGLHLGPAFQTAGIKTKILVYDHNADRPDYPITVLSDSIANPFIDGSAFHLYEGDISALTTVHNEFPNKDLYFTEQWTGAKGDFVSEFMWHMKNIIIGSVNNHAKAVIEWNLATDPTYGPHTPGGCSEFAGAAARGVWRRQLGGCGGCGGGRSL